MASMVIVEVQEPLEGGDSFSFGLVGADVGPFLEHGPRSRNQTLLNRSTAQSNCASKRYECILCPRRSALCQGPREAVGTLMIPQPTDGAGSRTVAVGQLATTR